MGGLIAPKYCKERQVCLIGQRSASPEVKHERQSEEQDHCQDQAPEAICVHVAIQPGSHQDPGEENGGRVGVECEDRCGQMVGDGVREDRDRAADKEQCLEPKNFTGCGSARGSRPGARTT